MVSRKKPDRHEAIFREKTKSKFWSDEKEVAALNAKIEQAFDEANINVN